MPIFCVKVVMVLKIEGVNFLFDATLAPINSPAMGDSKTGSCSCISNSSMPTTS